MIHRHSEQLLNRGDKVEDLKQAYKLLGLPEFATKEEVEARYSMLLRKERSRTKKLSDDQQNESDNSGEQTDFAQITAAYRKVLEYEDQKFTQAFNEQEYGKYKKLSGQAQKIDHFWRYYKIHTFGAIAAIALIIYAVTAYIDHREEQKYLASLPPIDLSVTLLGNYMINDGSSEYSIINEALLNSFPEWQRFDSSIIYVPHDEAQQYAYMQKAVVMLATEIPDIYILDENMFPWIGVQGALLSLDDAEELTPLMNDDIALKMTTNEENAAEQIYAIDLTDSKLAEDLPVYPQRLIVGIRANAKNPDKAKQFIRAYMESLP